MIFKGYILLLSVCAINLAHAGYPKIDEKYFNGVEKVISIEDAGDKYLAVLAKRTIKIKQIKYKKQKYLELKSKKYILKYIKSNSKNVKLIEFSNFKVVKYWEKANISYLISIINIKDINIVKNVFVDFKVDVEDVVVENKEKNNNESKLIKKVNANTKEDIDYLSKNDLMILYLKSLEEGNIELSNKYFNKMKGSHEK